MGVVLTFAYSLRFCFYLVWVKEFSRNKIRVVNDNIVYVVISVVRLVIIALFLGFVWFESITLFSIVLFVRVGWKLFY
jgi:hypothetical protein